MNLLRIISAGIIIFIVCMGLPVHAQQTRTVVIPLGDDGEEPTGNATPADVIEGKTFSSDAGTDQTGTMVNRGAVAITPGTSAQPISAGYHNGSGVVETDADLVGSNIKSGVEMFGVNGEIQGGCDCSGGTLNGTRWCDNGDGTVTDLLGDSFNNNVGRCLVWLKKANCDNTLWGIVKSGQITWRKAMSWSSALKNGDCGLTDASTEYEWKVPTKTELVSIGRGAEKVAFGNLRAFTDMPGLSSAWYWTITPDGAAETRVWQVKFTTGGANAYGSTDDGTEYVWPVRNPR